MSETGSVSGADRARRTDVRRSAAAAAVEDVATCRLGGVVRLLDDLAAHVVLTPDEYRWYFMAWQATRCLVARPADAAGVPDSRRSSVSVARSRSGSTSTTGRGGVANGMTGE